MTFFPDWGHVQPLMRVANSCLEAGYRVTCAIPEECQALVPSAEMDVVLLPVLKPAHLPEVFRRLSSESLFLLGFSANCHVNLWVLPDLFSQVPETLGIIQERLAGRKFDGVVTEPYAFHETYLRVAQLLNAPLVFFNASSTLAAFHPLYTRVFGREVSSRLWGKVIEIAGLFFQKLYVRCFYLRNYRRWLSLRRSRERIQSFFREVGGRSPSTSLPDARTAYSGLAWIENQFLEGRPGEANFTLIPPLAPVYRPLDSELSAWLGQDSQPVVYICFGSMVNIDGADVEDICRSLRKVNGRFVVSASGALFLEFEKRLEVGSDFFLSNFVSQAELLRHPNVRCFLTHGGASSALESLFAGTPLLVIPFYFDQPYIGFLVERLGVGRMIGKRKRRFEGIDIEITRLLGDEQIRTRAAELSRELNRPEVAQSASARALAFIRGR